MTTTLGTARSPGGQGRRVAMLARLATLLDDTEPHPGASPTALRRFLDASQLN
jgi:hypothetical protein